AEYAQLTDMPEAREIAEFTTDDVAKWDHFMKVRSDVLKALEEARNEKVIGKPLEAKVTIAAKDDETKAVLESIPHIHQLLIVSEAILGEKHEEAKEYQCVYVYVEKHDGEKCDRCWMHAHSVGENEKHPTLCNRCAEVVEEHY